MLFPLELSYQAPYLNAPSQKSRKIYCYNSITGRKKQSAFCPVLTIQTVKGRVKLYADSDIGTHLLLLLGENSTLADANIAAFAVLNMDEDIRRELEQNLLNDQYANTAEMLKDAMSEHDGMTMKKTNY